MHSSRCTSSLLFSSLLLLRFQFHTPGANPESLKERIRGLEERIVLLKEIKKDADARLAVSVTTTARARLLANRRGVPGGGEYACSTAVSLYVGGGVGFVLTILRS